MMTANHIHLQLTTDAYISENAGDHLLLSDDI